MNPLLMILIVSFIILTSLPTASSFTNPWTLHGKQRTNQSQLSMSSSSPSSLINPAEVQSTYGTNIAKYLIDLHDAETTFDFCGGMMFQLILSNQLYQHLKQIADITPADDLKNSGTNQPIIYDMDKIRMHHIPDYTKSSTADNIRIFHGRELRDIPHAKGGFGFVLHLSYADEGGSDPEGWSKEEIQTYDGWKHDAGRQWRTAGDYEREGFVGFKDKFHPKAFGLNHRFYLHYDRDGKMWLSAEDGCEGTPSLGGNFINRFFGRS